jgi:predicted PurR-regulated permease PerM
MLTNYTDNKFVLLKYLQLVFFASAILYFGSTLFVPICYGLLIAIVLYPICRWLEQKGWPRSLAITLGLLVVVILFCALVTLLIVQANVFWRDMPELMNKLTPMLAELQTWLEETLGLTVSAQNEWWQNTLQRIGNNAGDIARNTISATAGTFFMLFLVPVYAALFLYSRETFVDFALSLVRPENRQQLKNVLHEVVNTYFKFIKGMLLVYLIVGILNSIGLLALGIRHAILFGMLTAIMTIIPYVGIIVSALLPISVAWITKDSVWYPVGVVAVFAFVQYLEGNVIFPRVVATQLKVSTWITLVAIIAGGLLWGVNGMILFIPFVGILKVLFDNMPGTESLSILFERRERTKPVKK